MEKPNKKLIDALAERKVFFNEKLNVLEASEDRQKLAVEIEFALSPTADVQTPNFGIHTQSPRGVIFNFGNWKVSDAGGCKIFSFASTCELPRGLKVHVENQKQMVTTFADLCMNSGVEEVNDKYMPSVETPKKPDASYVDFSWYLPAYFTDHLIDALGKMNVFFLDGALENALIYGIISIGAKNEGN